MIKGEYYQNKGEPTEIIQIIEVEDKRCLTQEFNMSVSPVIFQKIPWEDHIDSDKIKQHYRRIPVDEVIVIRDAICDMIKHSFYEWVEDEDEERYVLTEYGKSLGGNINESNVL